jgi:hypothetical protein
LSSLTAPRKRRSHKEPNMHNIPTKHTARKSEHPDIYVEFLSTGDLAVVANRKTRKVLGKIVKGDRLPWGTLNGSSYLKPPEYRAFTVESGPELPQMLLALAHQAGLCAMYLCTSCDELHILNDTTAKQFLAEIDAVPPQATLQ